jgi:hypothetical protein
MVKTRSQQSQECVKNMIVTRSKSQTKSQTQTKTKSQLQTKLQTKFKKDKKDKNKSEQKESKNEEFPKIELPDRLIQRMKKRKLLRKRNEKKHQEQMHILYDIQDNANESKKQNNQEMTSIWKNLDSIFKYIDDFMSFKKRVEGK